MRRCVATPAFSLCLIAALHVGAARPVAAQPPPRASSVEIGGFDQPVTNGFGDWKGGYARLVVARPRDVWYAEAKMQEAFRDRGAYGSLANVHTFSSRFYTQIGVAAGSGEFVLPDLRLDASLNLKLGSSRALVLTGGGTLVDAKSGYRDRAAFGSLTWYAGASLLLEAGGRLNWSDPGAVVSRRGFGTISLGRAGSHLFVLRGSAGTEGYQLTGAALTLRQFRSQDAGVTWRQWLSRSAGLVLGGEWYHNPFYTRAGVTAGFFHAW